MQMKLLTLAYDRATASFPTDPLQDIDGEVTSVIEHFFHDNNDPRLLLIVSYRPHGDPPERRGQRNTSSVRFELTEDERKRFDRLRAWRNGVAQREAVPPYVLFTNRELADVARRCPTTIAALRDIPGIGDQKAGRFGKDLLALIAPSPAARP